MMRMNRVTAGIIGIILIVFFGTPGFAANKSLEERVVALEEGGASLLNGISFSGFVNTSYTYNFNRPDSGTNTYRIFDTEDNSFEVDLVKLVFEKESEGGLGFRTDLNFGHTAQLLGAGTTGSTVDDFEFQQAYITYSALGVDWMIGKFVTLHGAEVIEAPDNYNISRSFQFGYAIPFTHTGIIGTKKVNDMVDIKFGIVNGWDNTTDNNRGKTAHLGIGYSPSDQFSLSVNGMYGPEQDDDTANKRKLVDVLATISPMENLTLVLNYDVGKEENALSAGTMDAKWSAYSVILHSELSDRLGISLRGEKFKDGDGYRTGTDQDLKEATLTLSYLLGENLTFRCEYRMDKSSEKSFEDEGGKVKDSQDTVGLEMTYTF